MVGEIRKMVKPSQFDDNVALTRGYNMAFGVMSKKLYQLIGSEVFEALLKNAVPKGKESDDAETRKFATRSLYQAVKTCGPHNVPGAVLEGCVGTFYKCLSDYQIDRRGDVGSWVREQAMVSLNEFIYMLFSVPDQDQSLSQVYAEIRISLQANTSAFFERFVGQVIQQLCEKIDKVREVAGRALQEFFKQVIVPYHQKGQVVDFSLREPLTALFTSSDLLTGQPAGSVELGQVGYLPWRSAEFVFTSIRPFFDSDFYSISIFKGLITSSGGLTESTLKASSNSLFQYLSSLGPTE